MNFRTYLLSSVPPRWWVVSMVSVVALAAICLRAFGSEDVRAKRLEHNKRKELRSVTQRISSYGRAVHLRYPTGDVIVSESDLAEQLRKPPEAVATALNLLFIEQKFSGLHYGDIGNLTSKRGKQSGREDLRSDPLV